MRRLVLAFLLTATPVLAETFTIERIDVNAAHVKPAIVRAETRVAAGRSYTTEQLDQAIYRVRRLPFVVDATYSLEPGSSPDGRVLRINVIDQPMFNYNLGVEGIAVRGGYATSTAGLGLRFFPGPAGVIDLSSGGDSFSTGGGSASGHFGDIAARYTAYGLFGTSAYAGIGVSTRYEAKERLVSPTVLIGIPLTQTQTVRATYLRNGTQDENNDVLAAQWLYETTDDPYFGRKGLAVAAGPQWSKLNYHEVYNPGSRFEFVIDDHSKSRGIVANAAKFWPVAGHSALWVRGSETMLKYTGFNNGKRKLDEDIRYGDVLLGLAHNFDGGRASEDAFHRFRVELGAGYHQDRSSTRLFTSDRSGAEAFLGLAYRSRYGVIHLGVSYVENP